MYVWHEHVESVRDLRALRIKLSTLKQGYFITEPETNQKEGG